MAALPLQDEGGRNRLVQHAAFMVALGGICVRYRSRKPGDAPAGGVAFVDGSRTKATDYRTAFPYVNPPLPGAKNF